MSEFAFQFRVELLHFSPTIWRRIVVPSTYTFWDLHVAIQDAMGWKDTHLHLFRLIGTEDTYGIPSEDGDDMFPVLAGWETLIENHFDHMRPLALYEYDFGDGWLHSVLFENVEQGDSSVKLPVCIDGERHCPPEDCGGVEGMSGRAARDRGEPAGTTPRGREHGGPPPRPNRRGSFRSRPEDFLESWILRCAVPSTSAKLESP